MIQRPVKRVIQARKVTSPDAYQRLPCIQPPCPGHTRHSRAGGNPVGPGLLHLDRKQSALYRCAWIPACAGMTRWVAMAWWRGGRGVATNAQAEGDAYSRSRNQITHYQHKTANKGLTSSSRPRTGFQLPASSFKTTFPIHSASPQRYHASLIIMVPFAHA